MLGDIPLQDDPRILIDFRNSDDAGVYTWDGGPALVQTVDFFTPIVDDPYTYGEIAAANALSDIYAMGGRPATALAIAAFPKDGLDREVIQQITRGGFDMLLTSFGRGAVEAACDEAIACLDLIAREGCPHCRTKRERCADRGETEEPRIWYDTVSRDWLMWQPLEGCEDGVTLPLGIPRFDARRALVYRSAASLLFDSQLFLDEGL